MPNRILKESICDSESIDKLTAFQETMFYRLIVNCDDYGRFDARPKILASKLYPLKEVRTSQIEDALRALTSAELVTLYEVGGKPFLQMKTWDQHQQVRAKRSKFPAPDRNLISDDIKCNQMISYDSICSRNPIQSLSLSESESLSESFVADEDAGGIVSEHDRVLDAAENAGFTRSDAVRKKLIDLYATHGLRKMLDAINACVDYGVINIAYLSAVLKGEPKRKNTQTYAQRDYSGDQAQIVDEMMADWKNQQKKAVTE